MDLESVQLPTGAMYSAVETPLDQSEEYTELAVDICAEAVEEETADPVYVNYGEGWVIAFSCPEVNT